MNTQRGLGRGLGALIPTGQTVYREVPLSAIEVNPLQPRKHFDTESLGTLADSIRRIGVLQPIVVRETGIVGRYEIIAGERRWRASRMAGLAAIPAVVRAADEESSLTHALIENVQRADLNPLEEAAAYRQLIDDFGVTHSELGQRVGRSRAAVTNSLRLLSLPVTVQRYLLDGELSAGHARALLGCEDINEIDLLAERAVNEGWSVRAVEEAVRATGTASEDDTSPSQIEDQDDYEAPVVVVDDETERPAAVLEVEAALSEVLLTSVEVRLGARGGHIVVRFADLADLFRLYDSMSGNLQVSLDG